jgi:hypothetical protein
MVQWLHGGFDLAAGWAAMNYKKLFVKALIFEASGGEVR